MRYCLIMSACLLVAACGPDGDSNQVSGGDGESAATEAAIEAMSSSEIRPRAGQWEATGQVIDINMPGIPADQKGMMLEMMGKPTTFNYCLSEEDAQADPRKLWEETSGDCSFESFNMSGGTVDAVAVCRQQGTDARMRMTGTHTPESYSSRMEMEFEGPDGSGSMIIENSGRRVGACES